MMQRYKNGGSIPRNTMIAGQPHELSYITPTEAEILMGLGGAGVPVGPEQVPAYFDFGVDVAPPDNSGPGAEPSVGDDTGDATSGPGFGPDSGEADSVSGATSGATSGAVTGATSGAVTGSPTENMSFVDHVKATISDLGNITKSIAKQGGIPGLMGLAMKDAAKDAAMSFQANNGINFGQVSRAQQEANLAAVKNDDGTRTYSDAEIAEHLDATEKGIEEMNAINKDSNMESKPSDYVDLLDTEIEMDPCPEGFTYDEESFACVPVEDNAAPNVGTTPVDPVTPRPSPQPAITPYTPYTNTFIPTPLQPYTMDPMQKQLSDLKKSLQPKQAPRPRPGLAGIMQVRPE